MSLAELPILEETRHRLHHRLRDEHISFQELAPLVEMDAALCLNLQRHAVRINPDCLHQITGAANCLSLIGFKEVVRLVKRLPIVSAKTEVEEEKLYRLMLHNAAYAGTLNACLSAMKQSNNQATAKWSGMLASAPLWIWILKEPAARNWIYYLTLGQEATTASRMVFGQAIKEWQRLAMRLALPPLAMEFWKPDHWPTVRQWQSLRKLDPRDAEPKPNRELIHLCQQPAISLICANLLAVHTMALPFGKTFQRWLSITANMLGKPEPVLYSQLRQAMLSIAFQQQSAYGSGVYYWLSPAATQLPISLWIPKQEDKQIQPLSKSKPQT
ncbi:MAG: HDOD domain-containing protein, partial [Oceanobacter sp.]